MTNKQIACVSALDILFEGRNKEYGAYALRRTYNSRLLTALGMGLSLVLLLGFVTKVTSNPVVKPGQPASYYKEVKIDPVKLPGHKQAKQVLQKKIPAQRPVKQLSTTDFNTPRIVKDNAVRSAMSEIAATADMVRGNENDGEKSDGNIANNADGETSIPDEPPVIKDPPLPSAPPQFPGGLEALREFMARNLVTPITWR